MDAIIWETQQVALGDLVEWDKNPVILSTHDEQQIQLLLERFGLVLPLVANQPVENGKRKLIDGHQRKTILLYSEMAELTTKVDVRSPSRALTEKECAELSLRLRRHMGSFDWDMIGAEFDTEWLLSQVGFLEDDLDLDLTMSDIDLDEETDTQTSEEFTCPKCGYKWAEV